MGALVRFLRHGLVVVFHGPLGVEPEVELVLPAELEARLRQRVVARLRARVALGQVGGVGSDAVSHQAFAHVVLVGQAQVLLGRDVAEHRRAVPADQRRADGAGDVVVARRDVGGQRAEGVERRLAALGQLLVHVLLDQVHRHVAGPLDHGLDVVLPGDPGQFAQGLELGELGGVVGIGDRAGPQAVAEAEGHVVGLHDFADLLEVLVEEALAVVGQAPLGHDRTAAADDAGDPLGGQRNVAQQHPGVDGEVVHALLGLLDQRVAEHLPGQRLGHAADLLQRLVDRHRADRHRRVADDPLAGLVDVLAGGQVHDVVRAPADRPDQLLHLLGDPRRHRRVADVGVDLGQEVAADDHRLALGVVDVARDNGAAAGDLVADELRGDAHRDGGAEGLSRMLGQQSGIGQRIQALVLADGDVLHLRRDDPAPGVVHLGDVGARQCAARTRAVGEADGLELRVGLPLAAVVGRGTVQLHRVTALRNPLRAQRRQAAVEVDGDVRIRIRAGGVVDRQRRIVLAAEQRRRTLEHHLAHGHAQVRPRTGHVDLARTRDRADDIGGKLVGLTGQVGGHCIHGVVPLQEESRKLRTHEAGAHGPPDEPRPREASLRRYQPHQVRRVCLNRAPVGRAVPPLLGILEHGGVGKASVEPRGSDVDPWISPDFWGDKT